MIFLKDEVNMEKNNIVEMIDIPFIYTTFLAFIMVLRHQEKYNIPINNLKKYHKELVEDLPYPKLL